MKSLILYAVLALVLTACAPENDNDPGVGGVTVGEARALNEAAAKLDGNVYDPVGNEANRR